MKSICFSYSLIFNYYSFQSTWFSILSKKQWMRIFREFCLFIIITFYRTQISLTLEFALSNFHIQEYDFRNAILNMKKPSIDRLALENIYIMLSRINEWENLAILRSFEDNILQDILNKKLAAYDKFLEQMHYDIKHRMQ